MTECSFAGRYNPNIWLNGLSKITKYLSHNSCLRDENRARNVPGAYETEAEKGASKIKYLGYNTGHV